MKKFVQFEAKHNHLRSESRVFYNGNKHKIFEKQNIIFDGYLGSKAVIAFMHLTQKAIRWPMRCKLRSYLKWLAERLMQSSSCFVDKSAKAYDRVLHNKGGLS